MKVYLHKFKTVAIFFQENLKWKIHLAIGILLDSYLFDNQAKDIITDYNFCISLNQLINFLVTYFLMPATSNDA